MVLTDDNFATIVAGGRGRPPGLRQHPQVHPLHLRPRHARGRAVPGLRALGRRDPAAADGAADPRDRPRHRDPPGARARPRAGRARPHGAAAAAALRRRDPALAAVRAWLFLGLIEAALVLAGFFSSSRVPAGARATTRRRARRSTTPTSQATTMTFAGIVACQVGTAFAARTERASLRSVGVFTNPLLLWGIAFELAVLRGDRLPPAAPGRLRHRSRWASRSSRSSRRSPSSSGAPTSGAVRISAARRESRSPDPRRRG